MKKGSGICSTLRNFIVYRLLNVVRVIKSKKLGGAEHVARMKDGISTLQILIGKLSRKSPLGMSRRRWENNIRMILKKK